MKKESKFIRLLTMFGVPGNFRSMNLPPNNCKESFISGEDVKGNLGAEEGKDAEEEEEEDEEGGDGLDGGDERLEQVLQGLPIPGHLQVKVGLCETDTATLKALRRRMQRSTDIPTGGITLAMVRVISRMEVSTTKKSNRLKRGMK